MGKEWIEIRGIGQLYLERILATFDFPVLFVCTDFENRKFLCLNIDNETGKSVIAETSNRQLIDMLNNVVPMESVFRNSIDKKIIIAEYNSDDDEIISYTEDANITSKDSLPKKNEYFNLDNMTIREYISFLNRQIIPIDIEK